MKTFTLNINNQKRTITADADMPLLWVLRDLLGLTGTKYGCGVGVCGACTVHENSQAVRSCQINVADAVGKTYTTIEGLSAAGNHPCQKAWLDEDVAQCGYCQAGMIMTAAALIRDKSNPSQTEINTAMSESVCRCGTYLRMREAIRKAAVAARKL